MRNISAWFGFVALLCSRDVLACAPAPHAGERVYVVEESAVIIWEPATKTQHFIRRATFQGEARDFGFLVPTPTPPMLTAVDDVFDHLRRKTAPPVVHEVVKQIDWTPLVWLPFAMRYKGEGMTNVGAAPPVAVLSTQKVAGYEAAILEASDAVALNTWLGDNGYDSSPDLVEWLKAYVDKRWIISAFKIDKSADAVARTEAVRMSFTTDRPFFPYREPASQREGTSEPRMLAVFFVGPERVTGRIGGTTPWPGQMFWSDRIRDLELAGVNISPDLRMTAFEDHSSPRPGTDDLFFERDPDQQTKLPPPIVNKEYRTTWVPLDAIIAPIVVVGLVWRRRMKKRRATAPRTASP